MTAKGKGPKQLAKGEIMGLKAQVTRRVHRIEELEKQLAMAPSTEEHAYLKWQYKQAEEDLARAESKIRDLENTIYSLRDVINTLSVVHKDTACAVRNMAEHTNEVNKRTLFNEGAAFTKRRMHGNNYAPDTMKRLRAYCEKDVESTIKLSEMYKDKADN